MLFEYTEQQTQNFSLAYMTMEMEYWDGLTVQL